MTTIMTKKKYLFFSFSLLLLAPQAHASTADEMQALLEAGKPTEAYRLGKSKPDELGDVRFDFFYGIAAVNGGRASEGVLALERYLLNFSQNDIARLELARGYFLINDDGRATEEFEAVLAKKPAADVVRVANDYLSAIKDRASRNSTRVGFHLEAGGGRDSNVLSGVSNANITLPVFGDITLADSALARADTFYGLNLGADVTVPVRKGVSAFATITLDGRQYKQADIYNQDSATVSAGGNWVNGTNFYRLTISDSSLRLDQNHYRDSLSLSGDWAHQLAPNATFFSNLQAAKFSYAGANALRDADYGALTVGAKTQYAGLTRPELDFSLSLGREKNGIATRQDLSRNLYGAHVGLSFTPATSLTFALGASYLKSSYLAADSLLLVTRQDQYLAYDIAAIYAINRQWSIRAEYSATQNKSNLALYEYKRRVGQVKARYDY